MKLSSVSQVLAHASATMVESDLDVTGALATLLGGAAAALPADAAAILVDTDSGLQLLAATSHRTSDLELYQAQVQEGPCVDAIRSRRPVEAAGASLASRWPAAGPAIAGAGAGTQRRRRARASCMTCRAAWPRDVRCSSASASSRS